MLVNIDLDERVSEGIFLIEDINCISDLEMDGVIHGSNNPDTIEMLSVSLDLDKDLKKYRGITIFADKDSLDFDKIVKKYSESDEKYSLLIIKNPPDDVPLFKFSKYAGTQAIEMDKTLKDQPHLEELVFLKIVSIPE